jgi:uncharacterized phage protein (TIGR01671 family)
MREIKFRAWDKAYHCMVNREDSANLIGKWLRNPEVWEVMQYTGLRDKNDAEIYEGDIVRVITDDIDATTHQVKYMVEDCDYPAFDLVPDLDTDANGLAWAYHSVGYEIEVIGNIHESRELLK